MCFVYLDKVFNEVLWKVLEWVMRKKRISQVLVKSAGSLHDRTKTRVREDYELSGKIQVKVRIPQGSALLPFLFSAMVNVVTGVVMSAC